MKKDKEWFSEQIMKKYPSQSEIDNPDYEIIAKIEIIQEALSLIEQIESKTVESIISEFGELSLRKLDGKQLKVLMAVARDKEHYAKQETKNRLEGLYKEVTNNV